MWNVIRDMGNAKRMMRPLGAKPHLAPGFIHFVAQPDNVVELGDVCRHGKHICIADDGRDIFTCFLQLGLLDVGEDYLQTQSTKPGLISFRSFSDCKDTHALCEFLSGCTTNSTCSARDHGHSAGVKDGMEFVGDWGHGLDLVGRHATKWWRANR